MIRITGKIGTGSSQVLQVRYKRKAPKAGDMIEVRSIWAHDGPKWETVIVDEVRDRVGCSFYFLSRM